jgi:hypothetical protein
MALAGRLLRKELISAIGGKRMEAAAQAEELADEETLRNAWFEMLRSELDARRHAEPVPASIARTRGEQGEADLEPSPG